MYSGNNNLLNNSYCIYNYSNNNYIEITNITYSYIL